VAKYWALCDMVSSPRGGSGGTTTILMRPPPLGARFQAHYCATKGRLVTPSVALMEIDYNGTSSDVLGLDSASVLVFPDPITRVDSLSLAQRTRIKKILDTQFGADYDYQNQAGSIIAVAKCDTSDLLLATYTVQTLLDRLVEHLQIRKPTGLEDMLPFSAHNTEYTDDFATDPFVSRFSEIGGSTDWAYDSANEEIDFTSAAAATIARRDADTGSNEMEAQGTYLLGTNTGYPGPAARVRPSVTTGYFVEMETVGTGTVFYSKLVDGTYSNFATDAITLTDAVWITARLACEVSGSQVNQSFWRTNHTSTKPTDPGWIGADGTPDATAADTAANRILDADAQRGGCQCNTDTTAADWFKTRAISDRTAAGAPDTGPQIYLRPVQIREGRRRALTVFGRVLGIR